MLAPQFEREMVAEAQLDSGSAPASKVTSRAIAMSASFHQIDSMENGKHLSTRYLVAGSIFRLGGTTSRYRAEAYEVQCLNERRGRLRISLHGLGQGL